jgi:hypothetical protein
MGNTKYITFRGDIYPGGEEKIFTEKVLLEVAHGDHVALKVFHCYLHWDGEPTDREKTQYLLGHLTTHSMCGFAVVSFIATGMKSGIIETEDADAGEIFRLVVEDRIITKQFRLLEEAQPIKVRG